MSQTLFWHILPKKHYAGKGKLRDLLRNVSTLDESNLSYLNGLKDGELQEANTLIKAIEKYGKIGISVGE